MSKYFDRLPEWAETQKWPAIMEQHSLLGDVLFRLTETKRYALRAQALNRLIEKTRRVAARERQEAFEALLPTGHLDDTRFVHTDPRHRAILASTALKVRKIAWREAEWIAIFRSFTPEGMSPSARRGGSILMWMLAMLIDEDDGIRAQSCWDVSVPLRAPAFITIVAPTDADREEWQPDPTLWDVEDAAFHELESSMGGMASMYLHGVLHDEGKKRKKAAERIALYLADNRRKIPKDPWDPNNWGHDARLESLVMKNAQMEVIPLSPEFDPDTLEYTVSGNTAISTTKPVPVDTRATVTPAHTADASTYTVTAKDGVTKRIYTVKRLSE